jgi:hypothetical protein
MPVYLAHIAINTDDDSTTRRFWEETFDRTSTDGVRRDSPGHHVTPPATSPPPSRPAAS